LHCYISNACWSGLRQSADFQTNSLSQDELKHCAFVEKLHNVASFAAAQFDMTTIK